jgi:serine protease AprX
MRFRTLSLVLGGSAFLSSSAAAHTVAPVHPALTTRLENGEASVLAWVILRDKGIAAEDLGAAIARAAEELPARTLERRRLRRTAPGIADERDLPVPETYTRAIAETGAAIRRISRWANAVSVRATSEQLQAMARLSFVARIDPLRTGRGIRAFDLQPDVPAPYSDRDFYGRSSAQLTQINLPALHAQGYTGAGVIVGILDTGFNLAHDAFNQPGHPVNVIAQWDFINNDPNPGIEIGDSAGQHAHGTLILGCLGVYYPNELVGGAYNASFILCKTEDITSETPIEEDNYVAGLEFIELNGADVATSSLGYIDWYTQSDLDGATAVTTIAVNTATANGLHCCTAAGNSGHDTDPATSHLLAPADAVQVIACGAGRSDGTISSFSSDGPTADGRPKPELLARGSGTWTVHPDDPGVFAQVSGTSLSTPLVAAAVACLVQAYPSWTPAQMRAALFTTASDYAANGFPDPLFIRGYGFVNALGAAQWVSPPCDPDINCDGSADGFDVETMEQTVAGNAANFCQPDPDFNRDGSVDGFDVETLESTIGGNPCPG